MQKFATFADSNLNIYPLILSLKIMHILYMDAYFELLSCIQVIFSADLLVLVQS